MLLRKKIIILFFILLQGSNLAADGINGLPIDFYKKKSPVRAPTPLGFFEKLVIPINHVENLLLIEVTINGLVGNFILDTGAPCLILNQTYFREGMAQAGQTATGITGDGAEVLRTRIEKLQIQDLYYENLEAEVTNLSQIENSKGVKVLGLLGTNLFTEFEIEIDVRGDFVTIYKLDKNGERLHLEKQTKTEDVKIPFTLNNNIIYINGKIKEKELRFCFDTGAEVNVLASHTNRKVLTEFTVLRRSVLVGAAGQKAEVLSGYVKQLKIGEVGFTAMQTYLSSISSLQTVYDSFFDGILGYPLLFNGVVNINFKKKEFLMYLYKN
jgi:predicted aspartyl protease